MEGDKKKKSGTVQDKRFQHVHTDPRFQRAAKSERKFKPDARFQSMFTDKKFNENYKVDAWGRKIETGTNTSELLKYYDMDEETKAALTKKSNAGGKKAAGAKGGKKSTAKGDDDESVAPVTDKKSSKKSKSKPAPPADDDEEDYDDDDDGEQGFDGNYMSDRMMAPPSSEEEDEDGEEDDEEDEAAEDDDDEEDVDGDVADDDAPSTSSEEDEDDVEMEVVPEEEEIPIGEETSRRLAVMNLEWDRLSSVDLLVLFRSFVPQVAGSLHHPIKCVKVYPSEFGRQRMADEAKYGPTNIYAGGMTPEEYKKRLDEKMSRVKVTNYESDEEEDKVEEEDESERSDESEDEFDTTTKSKKKRVSFPAGTKNSKKPSKTVAATPRKASKVKDEFDEAEDDILARPAIDESDAEDGGDSDNDSHGSEDSGAEFDPDKLRQYELERLKYYYAIVECDTPATAEALYRSCDGLEFEHSSNLIDLRYVPDDVSFDEDEPFIRDQCSKVPTNYKAPEFYTQALQHTKVQLTWDRDDPTRQKLLSKKFKQEDEALQDLKAYLGSDGEEDGYGSDALTEASDSGSDENENEEVEEEADEDRAGKLPKKKKVTLKRKARSKYLALLQELKAPTDDGDENGDDENREVTITFEPGLKAKGEEIAAKALNKSNQVEESTWEKHLRERLEKKKAKKKARKEKLKALNEGADGDADADARGEDDSGDEIGGANAKIESDLYEDDEVDYDPNDDFFQLSDEDEFEPSKKGKGGRKSAIVSDDDDGDEDEIEMSSESDENGPSEDDDDDGEDDIDAFHGKEKAKRFFDDSAPKAKSKPASEKEKPTKKLDKKRKRAEDDEEEDAEDVADKSQSAAAVRAAREKEQAELDLLMMDEDDSNDAGQKGYSLQTLLKQKKASQQAEAGGKKKRRKGATGSDLAPADDFAVDTKDERFSALFSDAAFSIDPTHPAFKSTEGTDQLLHEKARRRQEQEKEQAKEIARRKEQAKQAATANKHKFGRVDNTPIGAAVSVSESAAAASSSAPASTSTSSSLASLVASVKRKTAAVNESKKNAAKVVPVGKNTAPASKRSKPDANMN